MTFHIAARLLSTRKILHSFIHNHICNLRMVHITAKPDTALLDDVVDISVRGLSPRQNVTVNALLRDDRHNFWSNGHFVSDHNGDLDINRQCSTGGTFKGVLPMGLFASLAPEGGRKSGIRLRKKDVTQPHIVELSVINGHASPVSDASLSACDILAKASMNWGYMAEDVIRVPIRKGRLRGTLFLPNKGQGQFPGLIDLYGTTGGLAEYRAALFASRGFAALALAYFGYDDLPKTPVLELDYFEEGVDFLSTHPSVSPGGIASVGISKGAEMALYCAVPRSQVKAVVSIGGTPILATLDHTLHGKVLPTMYPDSEHVEFTEDNVIDYRRAFIEQSKHATPDMFIPYEKATDCSFLFTHGTDDHINDSQLAIMCAQRLIEHGRPDSFELHIYQGAGHLLEPGFMPYCPYSIHRIIGMNMMWGGVSAEDHAHGQIEAWRTTLRFLRERLPKPATVTSKL